MASIGQLYGQRPKGFEHLRRSYKSIDGSTSRFHAQISHKLKLPTAIGGELCGVLNLWT